MKALHAQLADKDSDEESLQEFVMEDRYGNLRIASYPAYHYREPTERFLRNKHDTRRAPLEVNTRTRYAYHAIRDGGVKYQEQILKWRAQNVLIHNEKIRL